MPYLTYSRFIPKGPLVMNYGKGKSFGAGVRYDFATNLALKAEWAAYDTNNFLIFTDAVRPAAADRRVNTLSVALDFVF